MQLEKGIFRTPSPFPSYIRYNMISVDELLKMKAEVLLVVN